MAIGPWQLRIPSLLEKVVVEVEALLDNEIDDREDVYLPLSINTEYDTNKYPVDYVDLSVVLGQRYTDAGWEQVDVRIVGDKVYLTLGMVGIDDGTSDESDQLTDEEEEALETVLGTKKHPTKKVTKKAAKHPTKKAYMKPAKSRSRHPVESPAE